MSKRTIMIILVTAGILLFLIIQSNTITIFHVTKEISLVVNGGTELAVEQYKCGQTYLILPMHSPNSYNGLPLVINQEKKVISVPNNPIWSIPDMLVLYKRDQLPGILLDQKKGLGSVLCWNESGVTFYLDDSEIARYHLCWQ